MGIIDRLLGGAAEADEEEANYACQTCGKEFETHHVACETCGGSIVELA